MDKIAMPLWIILGLLGAIVAVDHYQKNHESAPQTAPVPNMEPVPPPAPDKSEPIVQPNEPKVEPRSPSQPMQPPMQPQPQRGRRFMPSCPNCR